MGGKGLSSLSLHPPPPSSKDTSSFTAYGYLIAPALFLEKDYPFPTELPCHLYRI